MKPKPTVLFIDGDATTRRVYTAGLVMAGIILHMAASAKEAGRSSWEEGRCDRHRPHDAQLQRR